MKDAYILVTHGSSSRKSIESFDSLLKKIKSLMGTDAVYPAFLQFSEQSLEKAAEKAAAEGASRVRIVPLFLFEGVHFERDVVEAVERLRLRYTGMEITLAGVIGDDDRLAEILAEKMKERGVM